LCEIREIEISGSADPIKIHPIACSNHVVMRATIGRPATSHQEIRGISPCSAPDRFEDKVLKNS